MSTMTSLNEQCPGCGAFEMIVVTDIGTYEEFSVCPVCGATTNSITGEDYAPDTFFQAYGNLAHKVEDLIMPAEPKRAEEWLRDSEDWGIVFTHAVIIDTDGKITWLRGSPANFCWKEEDITIFGLRNVPKKLTQLETGMHYWYRQVYEKIWRTCYVAEAPDDIQWLMPLSIDPIQVGKMDLSFFDFVEITPPASE